jgi:hypothetical protein
MNFVGNMWILFSRNHSSFKKTIDRKQWFIADRFSIALLTKNMKQPTLRSSASPASLTLITYQREQGRSTPSKFPIWWLFFRRGLNPLLKKNSIELPLKLLISNLRRMTGH